MVHPSTKVAIVAAEHELAQEARQTLETRYPHVPEAEADVVVALGGDGFMLKILHRHMANGTPIYGMNKGSVGFLMNTFRVDDLPARLAAAQAFHLHTLRMIAETAGGARHEALAINEVSLLRQTRLAAKLRIFVDGINRLEEMVCDGALVSTPAGSTAYNLSAYGPILPLGSELLALTPISAFRPRRWRGALLPRKAVVAFEVCEPDLRPVSAVADFTEVRDVVRVEVAESLSRPPVILFDPEHSLEERILKEQFMP